MRHVLALAPLALLICLLVAVLPAPSGSTSAPSAATPLDPADAAGVDAVLDELHRAAAAADGPRYFALFTPTAVFLGTDATERWTLDEFRAYAKPHFDAGKGWDYTSVERHLVPVPAAAAGGMVAVVLFDELLDNAKLGRCRGSGALVRTGDAWKIAQYNLSIPVPNDLALPVVELIRAANIRTKP